jgi:hypothetical protein
MMNANRVRALAIAVACALATTAVFGAGPAPPSGAKAIFDSGEGSSIAMSSNASRPAQPMAAAPESNRYVGISYQILQLSDDGQMRAVSQSRVFRNGERVKIIVRTNRPGYLTVMNVGPTGNTRVLYNEYVEAFRMIDVPRNTNLRFVGEPGTERLMFMLSNDPNPIASQYQAQTAAAPSGAPPMNGAPPPSAYAPPPPAYQAPPVAALPPPTDGQVPPIAYSPMPSTPGMPPGLEPPPTSSAVMASIDGAKSLKGAKDLIAEDGMQSSYTVLSRRDAYRPMRTGTKDLVLESQDGVNYGVLPVSAIADGGILTLDVSLRHQ